MTLDILLTLLNVVWGLILTGIGFEMVHNPPDTPAKKIVYRVLFGVFGAAVFATTFGQSARTATEQELSRTAAETRERQLLAKVSESDGKLTSIAQFEQQFLTFVSQQRPSSNTPDAAARGFEATALAVLKMAQGSNTPSSQPDAHLQILDEKGEKLDGRTILFSIPSNNPNPTIEVQEFRLKNSGGRVSGVVSIRLYFSKPVITGGGGPWQITTSDEAGFPSAFYSTGGSSYTINPQETFNWVAFQGRLSQVYTEPILVKLKVFYGSPTPSVANFSLRKR